MKTNYSVSVDGFGERDDIALANDRMQGVMMDNYSARFNKPIPDAEFSEDGLQAFEICKNLVKKGGGRALYYKHQLNWDLPENVESEIAILAIEPEGWDSPVTDSENIDIQVNDLGHEVEITVFVFNP